MSDVHIIGNRMNDFELGRTLMIAMSLICMQLIKQACLAERAEWNDEHLHIY